MHASTLLVAASALLYAPFTAATISYTLSKAANPTTEQSDAYARIAAAMDAAVARYNAGSARASKALTVSYEPGVPTAEGNFNGDIRFGADASYSTERTALHEISHTLGIGQTQAFTDRCAANDWPAGTAVVQKYDGADAKINCGGGHIWPYGLNYESEMSEDAANIHVELIDAMLADGLAG